MVADDLHTRLAGKVAQVGVFIDGYAQLLERLDPRLAVQVLALDECAVEVEDRAARTGTGSRLTPMVED